MLRYARIRNVFGGRVPPIVVGAVLVVSSLLKVHQLATQPVIHQSYVTSRWLISAAAAADLALGLWLLSGFFPGPARRVAIVYFSGFFTFSGYVAGVRGASCGCFGSAPVAGWVPPVIDLLSIALLCCWRPADSFQLTPWRKPVRAAVALGLLSVGVSGIAAVAPAGGPAWLGPGPIAGQDDTVVLDPQSWVGSRFQIAQYIDVGDQLLKGDWDVVFYSESCPRCAEYIRTLGTDTARPSSHARLGSRIALIELPPFREGRAIVPKGTAYVRGKLSASVNWFMKTPAIVHLRDGVVLSYTEEGLHDRELERSALEAGQLRPGNQLPLT